jgi:hypothetical protein
MGNKGKLSSWGDSDYPWGDGEYRVRDFKTALNFLKLPTEFDGRDLANFICAICEHKNMAIALISILVNFRPEEQAHFELISDANDLESYKEWQIFFTRSAQLIISCEPWEGYGAAIPMNG